MTGIKRRLGSLLGPEGRVPQIEAGETRQTSPGEPAGVTIRKTGEAQYRMDVDVPSGLNADGTLAEPVLSEVQGHIDAAMEVVDPSAKKYTLLTAQDVVHELPPGRYALANTGIASQEALGYPTNARGLLFVDNWVGNQQSRILRYFAENGHVYTRAISPNNLREWRLLTDHMIWLTANDHLHDLKPGRYALANTGIADESLGYPKNTRGVVTVETFSSNDLNRAIRFTAETGEVYSQLILGGVPQGWVDLTKSNGSTPPPPSGGGKTDTTPRLIVNTEPGHSFYKDSEQGTLTADTTEKAVGTQSLQVSTAGDGSQTVVQLDNVGPFDLTKTNPKLWLRIPEWVNASSLIVYMGTDGHDDHYRWILSMPANRAQLEEGYWRQQTLADITAANTTGNPDPTRLTHIRIVSSDTGEGSFTYNFGPIYETPKSNAYPNGVVSMSFDDGRLNNYTVARPIMDTFGFSGTAYVAAYSLGSDGHMSVAQLKEMHDNSGWEVGGHTYAPGFHSERLTSFTEEELDGDMANFKQWQKDNDLTGTTYAYPGGTYNDLVKRVTLRYFKAARGIGRFWETLPPNDMGALTTPIYVRYPATTPDEVREKVSIAKEKGGWLHICFHGVQDESVSSLEYPTHLFREICEILHESGIPVRTVEQVIDSI